MDTVTATIDQQFLNGVLGKVKASGEREFKKTFDIPMLPDPTLRLKAAFLVSKMRAEINGDELKVFAKVSVRTPAPVPWSVRPFSYTADSEAVFELAMEGCVLCLRVTSLIVPVYVKIGGRRFEFGDFDACRLLSTAFEEKVKVLPEPYARKLPVELGGATVQVNVAQSSVAVRSGFLEASASLVAS